MFKPIQRQLWRNVGRHGRVAAPRRSYASAQEPFDWKDPLRASNLFTEEEVAIAETAETYCQEQMAPRVLGKIAHIRHAEQWN